MDSCFAQNNLELIRRAMGSEQYLMNSKVMFSSIVYVEDEDLDNTRLILK